MPRFMPERAPAGSALAQQTVRETLQNVKQQAMQMITPIYNPKVKRYQDPETGRFVTNPNVERVEKPVEVEKKGKKVESVQDVSKGTGKNQEVVKFTKEQLSTKPPYSRDPDKWQKKGGKIEIDEEGTWTYTDWEIPPNRVSYPGGFPDFKSAGMVKQEVPIGKFERYDLDFAKADELAPNGLKSDENTWHHHQGLTTMQEIDKEMHRRFRHMGGMSLSKK
ncbi:HNH endonuclease [Priestia flexa]|uniref:HNH endonuclease n=1 Tax=Priestia flexa TaxID=86664 RepID=UPI003D299B2E